MAQSMKAAVVREFGRPLKIEEVPVPTPGRGEILDQARRHRRLPYRSARGARRLAGEAEPAVHPRSRRSRACGGAWGRRDHAQGRRSCGARLAARCMRRVRVLPHRLGVALPVATQQRLQRQWQLRGIRHWSRCLRGSPTAQRGSGRTGPDPVRRRDDVQRDQRDRNQARRMDRDFGRRRPWPARDPICEGDGTACRRAGCHGREARACAELRRRCDGRCVAAGRHGTVLKADRRRRPWRVGHRRIAGGLQSGDPDGAPEGTVGSSGCHRANSARPSSTSS